VSETENPGTESSQTGILDDVLVLSGGLSEAARPLVRDRLSTLETHLSRWDPAGVTVEVSVKNREGREQQVMLRADLPGYPPLVAKVVDPNLDSALASAKRELIRQVEDEKTKREPKSNRQLRNKPTRARPLPQLASGAMGWEGSVAARHTTPAAPRGAWPVTGLGVVAGSPAAELRPRLGDRYRDFATDRARLLPFIW
jgi:ribosome-associated translation inhibitor RaiA